MEFPILTYSFQKNILENIFTRPEDPFKLKGRTLAFYHIYRFYLQQLVSYISDKLSIEMKHNLATTNHQHPK